MKECGRNYAHLQDEEMQVMVPPTSQWEPVVGK